MLAVQVSRLGRGLSRQHIVSSGVSFKDLKFRYHFQEFNYLVTPATSLPSHVPCSAPVSEPVCTTSADEHFPSGQHLPPPH